MEKKKTTQWKTEMTDVMAVEKGFGFVRGLVELAKSTTKRVTQTSKQQQDKLDLFNLCPNRNLHALFISQSAKARCQRSRASS